MSRLLPCPFCGGEATFRSVNMYQQPAVYVACLQSQCRTNMFPAGYDILHERKLTEIDCAKMAEKVWNSRRGSE